MFYHAAMRSCLLLLSLLLAARGSGFAQILPVLTVNDAFGVDAWKEDVARPGFKLQIQMDTQTVWSDVPSTSVEQVTLADTAAGYVTLRLAVSSSTTVGNHTLRLRYCDGATCGAQVSFPFTFATVAPVPLHAPLNPRVVPKGGTSGSGREIQ